MDVNRSFCAACWLARSPQFLLALLTWGVCACLLFLVVGCDPGSDPVEVDFSQKATKVMDMQTTNLEQRDRLRAAVGAMVSPQETFSLYRQLLAYVARELEMELEFLQRKTYAEVNQLLAEGEADLAFICSGPYVTGKKKHGLQLLATPVIQGSTFYHSYLIVHQESPYHNLQDLKGKTFAFTDPHSNTGRLVPEAWVQELGQNSQEFFQETLFTYSHDNSILAVAKGLVDGAAVDSLIWDFYDLQGSQSVQKTKIIRTSEPFGIPPVVATPALEQDLQKKLRDVLLQMHTDPEGADILQKLHIERFVSAKDEWYASIRRIQKKIDLDN